MFSMALCGPDQARVKMSELSRVNKQYIAPNAYECINLNRRRTTQRRITPLYFQVKLYSRFPPQGHVPLSNSGGKGDVWGGGEGDTGYNIGGKRWIGIPRLPFFQTRLARPQYRSPWARY